MKLLYFVLICLIAINNVANSSNTKHLSETQKESIFEGAGQRKLAEGDNYIIIYFNKEVTYSKYPNDYRQNIAKLKINNVEQNLENQLTIPSDTGLEVHFDKILNSFGYFFYGASDDNAKFITSVNFQNFDWSQLNTMYVLFYECSSLKSLDLSNFDLSKVTNMEYTFYGCSSLESVILPTNLQNVESMNQMFYRCTSLQSINLSNMDLSKLTSMDSMFSQCSSLESFTAPEILSNLQKIDKMFEFCSGLKSIDLSKFDTSKVSNMQNVFYKCTSLESVTLPENLQNVEYMNYMFSECSSLKSIDLSNCNLTSVVYMSYMFNGCTSLESVSFPESLQNLMNTQYMFYECSSLSSIDLSNIALSKVNNMHAMFHSCTKLESVIFPKSGPQGLTDMVNITNNCSSLTSIDFSMFKINEMCSILFFIEACDSLVAIDFPIFDLTRFQFTAGYGPSSFYFKYLNLIGFSGESTNFVNFILELHYNYHMSSLSVCVNDEEIIRTAKSLLNEQGDEMDLELCCNYTECLFTNPNYIKVYFNKECTYANGFENNYRPNIRTIFLDEVEKEKNEPLDVKKGSKMIIHFTTPLTDFSNFFSSQYDANVKNIISIDFSKFNSSLINKFSSSFKGCTSLQKLDLSTFTVSSETVISNMFEDCSSLVAIDISNFDLTNNEIHKIFRNLGKLLYVNLINCVGETNDIYTLLNALRDLSNNKKFICLNQDKFNDVDSYYKESNNGDSIENEIGNCCNFDLDNYECGYLLVSFFGESTYESGFQNIYRTNINEIFLNDVKTNKYESLKIQAGSKMKIYFDSVPTNLNNFFDVQYDPNVVNIDSIDFSHMDLSKVSEMFLLFNGCSSLESVTFSKYPPKDINNIVGIFAGCSAIKSIDLSNFIIPSNARFTPMFPGNENLIAVDFPNIQLTGQTLLSLFGLSSPFGPPPSQSEILPSNLKYMNLSSLSGFESESTGADFFFFLF